MNILEDLTIIIPTYNREKRLKKTLENLKSLKRKLKIKILDNNSTMYDIEAMLINYQNYFDLQLIRNKENIERIGNFNRCFLECDTKWMWLLSDDDEVLKEALYNIEQEILINPSVGLIKFSIEGIGNQGEEKEEIVESIEEFIDHYYYDEISKGGQMVFISNNIFNIEQLKEYYSDMYHYSYIQIPYLVPVFKGLSYRKIKVKFSNKKIVKYIPPDGDHWDVLKVCLGVSTISHLPLNLDKKYLKKFIKIFNWISLEWLFKSILKNKNKNGSYYFGLLYNSLYKYHLSFKDKLKYPLYKFFIYLNENTRINFYEVLKKIKVSLKVK